MRISTRLLIALSAAVTVVMAIYGLVALRQREALLADALARETETLARTLQITTNNALRDGRFEDLRDVLARVAEDAETFAAAVLDPSQGVFAGGPVEAVECLSRYAPLAARAGEVGGWAACEGRVRWVALETRPPGSVLVVARRATVIERDIVSSRWRMGFTTLALASVAGLAILVVLRTSLSNPLAEVMRGVRSLGRDRPPKEFRVDRTAGEIGELAAAFNEMATRLESNERSLIQESDERIALERRLRHSEKFAALGRLTGGLAHELGSSLNVIGVRAEAILANPREALPVGRHAEEILEEIDSVARLVRSLSHVARRHRIQPDRVDLRDVVASVAAEAGGRAEESGVEVGLDLPTGSAETMGDATLLRHAISNLVTNALQSLATGSHPRHMTVRLSRSGPGASRTGWIVTIEDNGPGIAEADLPHVGEPFFTTKDVGEGMGLGLAISRGIFEEHDGELTIERLNHGGVRAVAWLPSEDPE